MRRIGGSLDLVVLVDGLVKVGVVVLLLDIVDDIVELLANLLHLIVLVHALGR